MARIRLWIRHFLTCRVRVLSLSIFAYDNWVGLNGLTLISPHLRKLHLFEICFEDKMLDFSSCPALEVVEINGCNITDAHTISSQSLRCLSIIGDCLFDEESRLHILAPNLHSLRLVVHYNRTPMLMRMPFLMEAFVYLSPYAMDFCDHYASSGDCERDYCEGCYGVDGDTNNCVLLQGLSEARNLVLISHPELFIFRRDLKWCPVFSNLKTLLLNEYWCVPSDFSALTYMLKHSPVLVKLTLELYCTGPKSELKILKGIPDPTERSDAMPEHLKTVEVKCTSVDDEVLGVLKFLSELRIHFHL